MLVKIQGKPYITHINSNKHFFRRLDFVFVLSLSNQESTHLQTVSMAHLIDSPPTATSRLECKINDQGIRYQPQKHQKQIFRIYSPGTLQRNRGYSETHNVRTASLSVLFMVRCILSNSYGFVCICAAYLSYRGNISIDYPVRESLVTTG